MRIQEKTKYKSAKHKKEGTRPEELETEELRGDEGSMKNRRETQESSLTCNI